MTNLKLNAKKVCFLGSATSSRSLAPFDDPDWEIWATGPGCHNDPEFKGRFDRWFEFHDMAMNDPKYGTVLDPYYFEWLQDVAKEKPVYYKPPLYEGLTGIEFPWDEITAKHSGYFLDSTVAEMMALLYDYGKDVEEIGIWGIDFATDEERQKQRKGAKHFIELFKLAGVPCYIPEVSEMAFDPLPYPMESKLSKKVTNQINLLIPQRESNAKMLSSLEEQVAELKLHKSRIDGTMQTLEHFKENLV